MKVLGYSIKSEAFWIVSFSLVPIAVGILVFLVARLFG